MAVIRESPWYLEILREGEQRGRQGGLQEGGATILLGQLTHRFGELDEAVQTRIRQLSMPQLDELSKSLLDFSSLTDLESWLEEH